MSPKVILCLVVLVLSTSETAAERPHIITIMIDDWGYHDIGYHGAEFNLHNLELLANSGVKLENYYVHSICSPTRSAFFAGRQDAELGIQNGVASAATRASVPGQDIWFTEELKDLGYETHMIGKWHIGYHTTLQVPTANGFDTFFGVLQGRTEYFTHQDADVDIGMLFEDATCDDEPYTIPDDQPIWGGDLWDGNTPVWKENIGNYTSILFAERAIKHIADHYDSGSDAPMYLNLAYTAVHNPWQAPKYAIESEACKGVKDGYDARRNLCGMLQVVDQGVGDILAALKAASYLENTLIMITSDNGGAAASPRPDFPITPASSNYPLRAGKSQYFEGGVRVTGILWGNPLRRGTVVRNEIVGKGVVSKSLFHVSDWFLTFQKAAGGNPPDLKTTDQASDGTQLATSHQQWDHLANGADSPREKMLIDIRWPQDPIFGAVRDRDYKLFVGSNNTQLDGWFDASDNSHDEPICGAVFATQCSDANLPPEMFFDITNDPNERNPLDIDNLSPDQQTHYDDLKLYIQRWASVEVHAQMAGVQWYVEALPNFWNCSWAPFKSQEIDPSQPSTPVNPTGNCKDTLLAEAMDCGKYPGEDDWLNYYDIPPPKTAPIFTSIQSYPEYNIVVVVGGSVSIAAVAVFLLRRRWAYKNVNTVTGV